MRKLVWIVLLLLGTPPSVAGQDSATVSETKKRVATLIGGVGNVLGWLGLHGEYYGYAPGVPEGEQQVGEVLALGFGYTWRR